MSNNLFNLNRALSIFGTSPGELLTRGIDQGRFPAFAKRPQDNRTLKSWSTAEIPILGEIVGFMKKPECPLAVSLFVTKGGVLKTSLTLNLARMAALHNIRTCVVGLDMQGDVTTALSADEVQDDSTSFDDALARMNSLRGLPDLFAGSCTIEDLLQSTDIPTLSYIAETPELVALDQSLMNRNRREYWLEEKVIAPLKQKFDLILIDCSPNWNRLITNALVAADVLISPLECKINNFRNFKAFKILLDDFKDDVRTEFTQIFVPTRLSHHRKLSQEIYQWYRANLPDCTLGAIRESSQGEEATAMKISISEFAPNSVAADEMRTLVEEIWIQILRQSVKLVPTLNASVAQHGSPIHLSI